MSAVILSFPTEGRAKQLIRERAEAEGFCGLTIVQLQRTFRPGRGSLEVQARHHVRSAHESATAPDFPGAA